MMTMALARPRSLSGNQLLIMVSTTGSMPPSETPRAKRRNSSWYWLVTSPVSTDITAQANSDQPMNFLPLPYTASLPPGTAETGNR